MAINLNPRINNSFGRVRLPESIQGYYKGLRGQEMLPVDESLYYWRQKPINGTTITKAGLSYNKPPEGIVPGGISLGGVTSTPENVIPFPEDMLNINSPQYSNNTGGLIENQRVGRQVGVFDESKDTSWQDWTSGIQFYTIYMGTNPKQLIQPIQVAAPARLDVWGNSMSSNGYVNRERGKDITYDELEYDCCGGKEIASANLGVPVPYISRVTHDFGVKAPLPVQMPGEFPRDVPSYSGYEINNNTWDWPQPTNPLIEIQRRKLGYPPTPIPDLYDDKLLRELRNGFNIS